MNDTRAVLRPVEPSQSGAEATCAYCNERVVWKAKQRQTKVVCNVYANGVWDRVESFHDTCYRDAGWPYGEAV